MKLYAQKNMLTEIGAKLDAGADPNATEPGDDRTPLFWAAWYGHEEIVTRLLLHEPARDRARTICRGRVGVPAEPACPMVVAHEEWGENSAVFAAFGKVLSSQEQIAARVAALKEDNTGSSSS